VLAGVGVAVREAVEDEPPVTAAQVFAAEDARVQSIPFEDGDLRVGISAELDRIAVDGSDMPAPPPKHAYQLWLVHDGQAESLSVMEGDSTTAVEEIPEGGVLAVTVEPSGGSDQPTTDPILSLDPAEL
jgi:anti-sigma-K factor RskA